jgi:hypothetical protein
LASPSSLPGDRGADWPARVVGVWVKTSIAADLQSWWFLEQTGRFEIGHPCAAINKSRQLVPIAQQFRRKEPSVNGRGSALWFMALATYCEAK